MRNFSGQSAGGTDLGFANREFASFLFHPAMTLEQDLDAVSSRGS